MLQVANFLFADGNLDALEMRTHFALWSIMGAPLILGHDLSDFADEPAAGRMTRAQFVDIVANPEVIAVNQDIGATIQGRNRTAAGAGGREVWSKPRSGGALAVLLLNAAPTNQTLTIRADWAALGLPTPAAKRAVRDLWTRKDLGDHAGGFSAKVAWHDAMLIKVEAPHAAAVEGG